MTWRSPDGITFNQIEHFFIDSSHKSDIEDIRGKFLERCDCKQVKDEAIKLKFQNQIDCNLEESKDNHRETGSINDIWNSLKETIVKTGNEVVGKAKKTKRKDWFDSKSYMITEKKNAAFKKMLNKRHSRNAKIKYKEARREEKRIHKTKKKAFLEDLLKNVEHLRGSNESRAFFREINLGRKEFKPRTTSCRDKNGAILTNKMQVLERWNEHFYELLNVVSDEHEPPTEDIEIYGQHIVEPPTLEEVDDGIKKLMDSKAPGPDEIPSEFLKNGGTSVTKKIYDLVRAIWEQKLIPEEWKTSMTCMIHKKGDILDCSNYRGISLLCTSYKVFSNILFKRLSPLVENIVGDYQADSGRGDPP
ncbi:uncharacterized protein [Parasteatoda tepidariorum]|uniref:uncharacterized protein n=1 Tax=Parasteatoda tepidariorum TaxID=114398 RepID=UPI0039BC7904